MYHYRIGSRAGNVGINSTFQIKNLILESVHIDENIFDSDNVQKIRYYLSRDAGGIRWVSPPNANADGIFARMKVLILVLDHSQQLI